MRTSRRLAEGRGGGEETLLMHRREGSPHRVFIVCRTARGRLHTMHLGCTCELHWSRCANSGFRRASERTYVGKVTKRIAKCVTANNTRERKIGGGRERFNYDRETRETYGITPMIRASVGCILNKVRARISACVSASFNNLIAF